MPLSPTAWHLSFARFLQIRLNCTLHGSQVVEECTHSMYKDYYQYFKCKDIVATFKYSSVTLREIVFPPDDVTLKHCITKDDVISRIKLVRKQWVSIFIYHYTATHHRMTLCPTQWTWLHFFTPKCDYNSVYVYLFNRGLKLYSSVVESFLKIEVRFLDNPSKKQIVAQNKDDLEVGSVPIILLTQLLNLGHLFIFLSAVLFRKRRNGL